MWAWEYMVLAFKVGVGGLLWSLLFMGIFVCMGLIAAACGYKHTPKGKGIRMPKPKYKGDPIVINGGKKDE